jgi:hypothetical protein
LNHSRELEFNQQQQMSKTMTLRERFLLPT